MNEISLFGSDLLLVVCAVVVSFALGSLHRLGRGLARQRRAVTLAEQDLRELTQQCDRHQVSVARLHQELSELRQVLMQQAMAMAPVHAAARAPAPASSVTAAPADVPAPPAASPAAPSRPGVKPAPCAGRNDPLMLAREGAGVQVLMQRCALSRAEAELVISVHGGKRRAAA